MVFPALRVMHAGDAFHTRDLPIMDKNNGGSGVEYSATLAKAASPVKNIDTIINGHNATTTTVADMRTQSEFIADFVKFVQDGKKAGKTVDDLAAAWKTPGEVHRIRAPQAGAREGRRAGHLGRDQVVGRHVMLLRGARSIGFVVTLTSLVALSGAGLGITVARAQRGAAPDPPAREARPPNPLGQPLLDPAGHPRDDAFIRIPLQPADRAYADLDGVRMKTYVQEVAAISRHDRERTGPRGFWGRNQATAGHVATQDWVEQYFRRFKLTDVRRQPVDVPPQWSVADWELTFTSAGKTYTFESARPSAGVDATPPSGRELDVIWLGTGSAADYLGRDVKGKAVIVQDYLTPGVLNQSITYEQTVQRAYERGAAAVGIVYGVADNFAVWEGTRGRPGFQIGAEDGKALRELLGQGRPVTLNYRIDSQMRSGLTSASVWGTLKGTTDEDILVIAHMDGFFEGAIDNGSGLAVMMGLADHYAKLPPSQRRRTLRFLGSVGHHSGPGTRWLHDNRETELAKTALIINLEHVAAVRTKYWGPHLRMTNAVSPMRWWVYGSPKLLSLAVNAFTHFNVGLTADMDSNASGEIGAIERDAPSMQVITSPEVKHTEQDGPEWVPAVGLEQVARAYARIIDDVNRLDRRDLLPAMKTDTTAASRP